MVFEWVEADSPSFLFNYGVLTLEARRRWKCECGSEGQAKIVTASDGEIVCGKCRTVLGQVARFKEDSTEQAEGGMRKVTFAERYWKSA